MIGRFACSDAVHAWWRNSSFWREGRRTVPQCDIIDGDIVLTTANIIEGAPSGVNVS
jgi:hypothetical protein